jgi:cation diffusion facilitator family transporter
MSSTAGAQPLSKYLLLSLLAAVATIAIKTGAYLVSGSVGLLSDAYESVVNLVAALLALLAVRVSEQPPDEEHGFGHGKAEYFSSGAEGALIFAAALAILWAAVQRLLEPRPIDRVGLGLGLSVGASLINLVVARVLLAAGRKHKSIVLEADAQHLMTDVWTSVGVVVGVSLVRWTGLTILDPLVAIAVALNILRTGWSLLRRSASALLDASLPADELALFTAILERFAREDQIQWHALRTRSAGRQRFADVHVLVPGAWTVQRAHDLLERLEEELRGAVGNLSVTTHLEPLEDPRSQEPEP